MEVASYSIVEVVERISTGGVNTVVDNNDVLQEKRLRLRRALRYNIISREVTCRKGVQVSGLTA